MTSDKENPKDVRSFRSKAGPLAISTSAVRGFALLAMTASAWHKLCKINLSTCPSTSAAALREENSLFREGLKTL